MCIVLRAWFVLCPSLPRQSSQNFCIFRVEKITASPFGAPLCWPPGAHAPIRSYWSNCTLTTRNKDDDDDAGDDFCWYTRVCYACQLYVTLVSLAVFIIPTFIISVCYIIIISVICRKAALLRQQPIVHWTTSNSSQRLSRTSSPARRYPLRYGLSPSWAISMLALTYVVLLQKQDVATGSTPKPVLFQFKK